MKWGALIFQVSLVFLSVGFGPGSFGMSGRVAFPPDMPGADLLQYLKRG